jgi:hypothetical protein
MLTVFQAGAVETVKGYDFAEGVSCPVQKVFD